MGEQRERPPRALLPSRRVVLAALALIAAHVFLLVWNARVMGRTTDEVYYLNGGHILLRHGWVHETTVVQGPLPLYANQLFVGKFPPGGYDGGDDQAELLWRARLGTLPFAVLAAVLVFLWARSVFGDSGGLLALAFHVANPLMLGYGALIMVDMHHSALVLLVLFVLWRYLETRSLRVLPWLGVALGLALATKYLAFLLIPPVAVTVALAALFRERASGLARLPAVLGGAVLALVLVATAALGTLHTCYRFREPMPPTDPGAYRSAALRAGLEIPAVGVAVKLLPAPLLRGLDWQLANSERDWRVFLDGRFAPGHPDYYLRAIGYETPELVLLGAAVLVLVRLPELRRAERRRRWGTTALATTPYALFAFLYLSLFTRNQVGVRYILPLYPLLFVWLGALARPERDDDTRAPGARFFLLLTALLALHARELVLSWPDWISYFNAASGGEAGAYRHFRNDLGQHPVADVESLAAHLGPVAVLGRHSGPRFGRIAVDDDALRAPDPFDPTRSRFDWLTIEPPLTHLGASWYVFECSPERLEAQLASGEDPQLRAALASGWLGEGHTDVARQHLAHLDQEIAAPYQRVLELLERTRENPDRAGLEALALAWRRVGRPDRVEELARAHPELADSTEVAVGRALAFEERGDFPGGIDVLWTRQDELDARDTLLLVQMLVRDRQSERASEAFDLLEQRLASVEHGGVERLLEETRQQVETLRSLTELLR